MGHFVDKKVYLGFRPGAGKIVESGQLVGEIIFIQTLEEFNFAHVSLTDTIDVTVKLEEGMAMSSEKLLRLNVEPNKMYFFDAEGKRIHFE